MVDNLSRISKIRAQHTPHLLTIVLLELPSGKVQCDSRVEDICGKCTSEHEEKRRVRHVSWLWDAWRLD